MQGAVRARALLEAQEPAALAAIRAAVAGGVARFAVSGDGYHIPMPALVGSGRRPT